MSKEKLPTIRELYDSEELKPYQKDSVFQQLVNQPPKQEWIKLHPIFRRVQYLPIERVEWLLTNIFNNWYVEINDIKILANSIVTTLRLHYQNPITEKWQHQDGCGASPLQTNKDAGAIDFNQIKSDAVMKAAPASKSFAVKDAAEQIGRLFGRDLNRADNISYDSLDIKDYAIDQYGDQAMYIGVLLDNSLLTSDEQVAIEKEVASGMTPDRASEVIEHLQSNQQHPIKDKGAPSKTEAKDAAADKMEDSECKNKY